MLTKSKVLETVASLPEHFSLDELVERLIILEKIQIGRLQAEKGKVLSHEEAKKRLNKWRK